jgi:hypothetical protein
MEKEAAIKGAKIIEKISDIKEKIQSIDFVIAYKDSYYSYLSYEHQCQVSAPRKIEIPDEIKTKILQDVRTGYATKLTLLEEELKKL